jgi:hypothetical protein
MRAESLLLRAVAEPAYRRPQPVRLRGVA